MSLDILSFLEREFDRISIVPSTYGQYRVSPCPNCGNTNRKLYVNIDKKVFHCFVCDYGRGSRIEKLFWDMGSNPHDYVVDDGVDEEIVNLSPANLPHLNDRNEKRLPETYRMLIGNTSVTGKLALSYMRSRGVSDNIIQDYKIGFCYDGKFKNRIIVPYYENEELVYFSARDFTGVQQPKYLNPDWERYNILFNYERASRSISHVVLVEGVFDIFSLPDHAVCLLGKFLSPAQKHKLKIFKKIYIALDSDASVNAVDLGVSLSSDGFDNVYIVDMPKNEDPSSLKGDFVNYINNAKPYSNFSNESFVNRISVLLNSKK